MSNFDGQSSFPKSERGILLPGFCREAPGSYAGSSHKGPVFDAFKAIGAATIGLLVVSGEIKKKKVWNDMRQD